MTQEHVANNVRQRLPTPRTPQAQAMTLVWRTNQGLTHARAAALRAFSSALAAPFLPLRCHWCVTVHMHTCTNCVRYMTSPESNTYELLSKELLSKKRGLTHIPRQNRYCGAGSPRLSRAASLQIKRFPRLLHCQELARATGSGMGHNWLPHWHPQALHARPLRLPTPPVFFNFI